MPVTLRDIPGCLPYMIGDIDYSPSYRMGHNKVISIVGAVKIGINREKLAERLYTRYERYKGQKLWNEVTNKITRGIWLAEADSIIAKEHELLEAVK